MEKKSFESGIVEPKNETTITNFLWIVEVGKVLQYIYIHERQASLGLA
jgi:hypothetical protein